MNTAGAIVAYFAYTPDPAQRGGDPRRPQQHLREDRALDRVQHRADAPDLQPYSPTGEEWAQIATSGTIWLVSHSCWASGGCCGSSSSSRACRARLDLSRPAGCRSLGWSRVELRKACDTRAGFWLLAAIVGLVVVVPGIALVITLVRTDPILLDDFVGIAAYMMSFLLPFLAIMLVTSEWCQRSALVTFTLEPRRSRVVLAKMARGAAAHRDQPGRGARDRRALHGHLRAGAARPDLVAAGRRQRRRVLRHRGRWRCWAASRSPRCCSTPRRRSCSSWSTGSCCPGSSPRWPR